MDYLRNHCWCSDSNWGGEYDCQVMVSLNNYRAGYTEDWNNLMTEKMCTEGVDTITLKQEVLDWLVSNIPDYKDDKGWCVGSDEYTSNDTSVSYSVFFQRRRDAMKFIKTWSKWKKPINYCQYFTDVRKRLNLETGKYEEL